jgi:hypothetical protein
LDGVVDGVTLPASLWPSTKALPLSSSQLKEKIKKKTKKKTKKKKKTWV